MLNEIFHLKAFHKRLNNVAANFNTIDGKMQLRTSTCLYSCYLAHKFFVHQFLCLIHIVESAQDCKIIISVQHFHFTMNTVVEFWLSKKSIFELFLKG